MSSSKRRYGEIRPGDLHIHALEGALSAAIAHARTGPGTPVGGVLLGESHGDTIEVWGFSPLASHGEIPFETWEEAASAAGVVGMMVSHPDVDLRHRDLEVYERYFPGRRVVLVVDPMPESVGWYQRNRGRVRGCGFFLVREAGAKKKRKERLPEKAPPPQWQAEGGGGGGLPIYVPATLLQSIVARAARGRSMTIGILLGEAFSFLGDDYIELQEHLPVDAPSTEDTLTMTQQTWAAIRAAKAERDRKGPEERILGWTVSQPGRGVSLSEENAAFHRKFFPEPCEVALIVDPRAGRVGFFQWKDGRIAACGYRLVRG